MRLLFLNPIGHIGGAERVLLTAISAVKREAPDAAIRLIALAEGPLVAASQELGAEVEVVPLPPVLAEIGDSRMEGGRMALAQRSLRGMPALGPFLRRLKAAVRTSAPEVVHSNGIKTHLLARLVVPAAVPIVWHLHDFYEPASRGADGSCGGLVRECASPIAISRAVEVDARTVLPGVRIDVVPNAVDHGAVFAGPRRRIRPRSPRRSSARSPGGTVRVGLVATYARWKGHLTVLDAAARLAARAPHLPIRWFLSAGPSITPPPSSRRPNCGRRSDVRDLSR